MAQELLVGAIFIEDDRLVDGTVVAFIDAKLLWAGPVSVCPLSEFPVGTKVHVHPALYARIASNVAKVEDGTPYQQSPH